MKSKDDVEKIKMFYTSIQSIWAVSGALFFVRYTNASHQNALTHLNIR